VTPPLDERAWRRRPLRNTDRVLTNAGVERLLEKERSLGASINLADIAPEVAGVKGGEMDAGVGFAVRLASLLAS
jgi:NADH:quinone reductase (non-electrogenic)